MRPTDAQIVENRERYSRALSRPDLVAMRAEIQRRYQAACSASRIADAADRACARGFGGGSDHLTERREWLRYETLFREYHHRLRPEALAAAGVDNDLLGMATTEERDERGALEERLRSTPPMGWGTSQWPDPEERAQAWRRYCQESRHTHIHMAR